MSELRVLVADDEVLARRGMRRMLEREEGIRIVAECGDGAAAVESICSERPDLVFLDVQMPELDGFAVVDAVGAEAMPPVVFVTAYDEFALRAFNVHALDYVVKPVDPARLRETVRRVRGEIERRKMAEIGQRLAGLLETTASSRKPLRRFVVRSRDRIVLLEPDQVEWIESADNYVRLHAGADSYLLRDTMTSLESRLAETTFLRIRRSVMVRTGAIQELQPLFNGEFAVLLKSGKRLTSSRRYRAEIESFLASS